MKNSDPSRIDERGNSRLFRESCFKIFLATSKDIFSKLSKIDSRHEWRDRVFTFYVTPKGRFGGVDDRIVDVFYGNRKVRSVIEISADSENGFPRVHRKFIAESGAQLSYQLTDNARVICTLHPCKTDNLRAKEDFIILNFGLHPQRLTGRGTLQQHWKILSSYMEITSVDGVPSSLDLMRIWWIRWTRPQVIGGKMQQRVAFDFIGKIIYLSLTVGLSGFLLRIMDLLMKS